MTVRFITENFEKYDPSSLDAYLGIGGFTALRKAFGMSPQEIIETVKPCAIRGRGGAEYDLARKWSQAAAVPGTNKAVICNADEGEPGTFKDREIMTRDPFRLLEGIILSGYTVGARNAYLYIREEYRHLHASMKQAVAQCRAQGFLGENILGSGFDYDIHVYSGAGAYVCGEGSSLIESIEGKSGRPRIKPPYIKECGLWQRPTCVSNVETLALACAVLQNGPEAYLRHGTEGSPGTKIVTLSGNVKNPGAVEIPFGLTLREIIDGIGGGVSDEHTLKFFQLGGASGKIGPARLLDTPYTYEGLRKAGLMMGSGAILVADERTDILTFLRSVQAFFSHESCGKCAPCREGNRQLARILDQLAAGTGEPRAERLATAERYAQVMSGCSFCGLGQTAQNAFLSALRHFPEELGVAGSGENTGGESA